MRKRFESKMFLLSACFLHLSTMSTFSKKDHQTLLLSALSFGDIFNFQSVSKMMPSISLEARYLLFIYTSNHQKFSVSAQEYNCIFVRSPLLVLYSSANPLLFYIRPHLHSCFIFFRIFSHFILIKFFYTTNYQKNDDIVRTI